MKGTHMRLYTYENRKIHGKLAYEWLLEQARGIGIAGGSAFRALAGYGRHGELHECISTNWPGNNRCWSNSW